VSETGSWQSVGTSLRSEWRSVFNTEWSGIDVGGNCPRCGVASLHHWYAADTPADVKLRGSRYVAHGRLWEWCSNCRTFEYLPDGYVPEWWRPPFDVEPSILGYEPESIEQARLAQQ
jgi:hypothetical protein